MKITSKLLAALLVLAAALTLTACGGKNDAPARLSAEEARALYTVWLETHPELAEYTLSAVDDTYEWQGEQYHMFHTARPDWYWYNILVHTETGELLFLMTPDGEDPVTTVEPLEDWYAGAFAP